MNGCACVKIDSKHKGLFNHAGRSSVSAFDTCDGRKGAHSCYGEFLFTTFISLHTMDRDLFHQKKGRKREEIKKHREREGGREREVTYNKKR